MENPLPPFTLRITQDGRGGSVIVDVAGKSLHWSWEFGGGEALALIIVPGEARWEQETGMPVGQREAFLDAVGRQVKLRKGGRDVVVGEHTIEIMS